LSVTVTRLNAPSKIVRDANPEASLAPRNVSLSNIEGDDQPMRRRRRIPQQWTKI
jgi:hypothetical protein